MKVKVPPKRPAFMSEDKKTGQKIKSNSLLNFMTRAKKSFGGGIFDPHFKIKGGKLRPEASKGYFGITFKKDF